MEFGGRTVPLAGLKALGRFGGEGYDVILDRYITFSGAGFLYSLFSATPLVLEVNSPHVEELIYRYNIVDPLVRGALRTWVAAMFRRAELVVSPSLEIVPRLARTKTRLVEWAANVELFSPDLATSERTVKLKRETGLKGRGPIVIFVGTFRRWHGVRYLPDIVEKVTARHPTLRFLLVGDGDERGAIEAEISRRGLEARTIFMGSIAYEDMPHVLSMGDIGIAPYDVRAYPPLAKYGFFWSPLKIFEYMAAGLPAVVFGYDYLARVVADGERGLVVPPDDVDLFAEAVLELAGSAQKRRAMGKAGREYVVENYSWSGHVRHLEKLLYEVLARRRGVAP
jgi:glycosyltransferase involved in cell wall biosynthesis